MRKGVVLAAVALVLVFSVAAAAKMPAGSFLRSPATSVDQLVQQVVDDGIVAARYARHFQTSRNSVVDYFQSCLKIGRLRNDLEATVYTVSGQTDVTATRKVLPKGTYVFVGADRRPLLEAGTGNPLGATLSPAPAPVPKPAAVAGPTLHAAIPEAASAADGIVTKVLAAQPAEIGTMPAGVPSVPPAIEPAIDIVGSIPVGATPGAAVGLPSIGAVVPLALALGGFALAGGGGGQSPAPTEVPIPEPASLAALALGISGFAFARLRRRR